MIRVATTRDIVNVVMMGQRFISTTEYSSKIPVNLNAMTALVNGLIERPGSDILLSDVDGTTVGMLGLTLFHHPISGELTATELFWWVDPAYRGIDGIKLLKEGERWAQEHDAVILQMIAPNDRVENLYQRLGYDRVEVSYHRRLR